jgi:hypothetical protein
MTRFKNVRRGHLPDSLTKVGRRLAYRAGYREMFSVDSMEESAGLPVTGSM